MKARLLLAAALLAASAFAERRVATVPSLFPKVAEGRKGTVLFSPYAFELDAALLSEGFDPIAKAGVAEYLGVLVGYDSVYFPMMARLEAAATNGFSLVTAKGFVVPSFRAVTPDYRLQLQQEYATEVCTFRPNARGALAWFKAKMDGKMEDFALPETNPNEERMVFCDLCSLTTAWAESAPTKVTRFKAADFTLLKLPLRDEAAFYAFIPEQGVALETLRREFAAEKLSALVSVFHSVTEPRLKTVAAKVSMPELDVTSEIDLLPLFAAAKVPVKGFKSINSAYTPKAMVQRMRLRVERTEGAGQAERVEGAEETYSLERPFSFFICHEPTQAVVLMGEVYQQ